MVIYKVCEDAPIADSPKDMYILEYGKHFNKNLCEWAVSKMHHKNKDYITKTELDNLMRKYDVTLEHNKLFDYVFVGNMVKLDYYGSSIEDEKHLILCVKDIIDDEDSYEGHVFCRFCKDACEMNLDIDWEAMINNK